MNIIYICVLCYYRKKDKVIAGARSCKKDAIRNSACANSQARARTEVTCKILRGALDHVVEIGCVVR